MTHLSKMEFVPSSRIATLTLNSHTHETELEEYFSAPSIDTLKYQKINFFPKQIHVFFRSLVKCTTGIKQDHSGDRQDDRELSLQESSVKTTKECLAPILDMQFQDYECAICLDFLSNPFIIPECCHRAIIYIKSIEAGSKECPTCRVHIVSNRSLR